jgi:hypothetical protein
MSEQPGEDLGSIMASLLFAEVIIALVVIGAVLAIIG